MNFRFLLKSIFRRNSLEADMAEEMRQHLELRERANLAAGMSPAEAREAARRQFGGVEQLKEQVRDERQSVWLEQLGQDFGYAWRQLRRTPAFTAMGVLTLALGVGLVTVQFSFVHGVAFTGPDFPGAERVMSVTTRRSDGSDTIASLRHFLEWRARQSAFDRFAAFRRGGVVLRGGDVLPRMHIVAESTADIFTIPGMPPALGRVLQPADEAAGAPRVLVLGWNTWKNEFAADPSIVGRTVQANGEPATIVGVMPAGFEFPIAEEVWMNLRLPQAGREGDWFEPVQIVGRRRVEVGAVQAQLQFQALLTLIAADGPRRGVIGTQAVLMSFAKAELGTPFLKTVWTLFAMAALVLVLACLNVANLLHVRSLRQRRELAVRLALGASSGRIARQMLATSLLLAGLGAAGGMIVATWCVPLLDPFIADPRKPYWIKLAVNWPVFAAVAAITILVGVVAGLLPALRARRIDANVVLRDAPGSTGLALGRSGRVLSIVQVALAAAVLVVGAALGRGVRQLARESSPPGAEQVLVASDLASPPVGGAAAGSRFLPELLERVGVWPEVQAAAVRVPGMLTPIMLEGTDPADRARAGSFPLEWISADYFAVFGVNARRGRVFAATDAGPGTRVVVINESCARRFWGERDPVGQRLRFEGTEGLGDWHTVVGVVPDLPMARNRGVLHQPGIYAVLDWRVSSGRAALLLRTRGDPAVVAVPLRKLVRELAPDQPFRAVRPLVAAIDEDMQVRRLLSALALVFGCSGALLAALGLFTVQAFFVESRRREFGVRVALGARPGQILRLVLRRGVAGLAGGLIVGLGLGWGLGRVLQGTGAPLLGSISKIDPGDYAVAGALLGLAVLLASLLPAWRAARVAPLVALRSE